MTPVRLRQPAVAGTFYAAEPAALSRQLDEAFRQARSPVAGPVPKAIVAPHAGYIFSGPVAATAYDHVRAARGVIKRVVLLGPSHWVGFSGLAVPSADQLMTPLGAVRVDDEGRAAVLAFPYVAVLDEPHQREHSLEVHLPFIQRVLGDVTVVPLVVGHASPDEVGDLLDAVWGGQETLIVVSTDLSHYDDQATATVRDRATADAVEAGRLADIGSWDACGSQPLRGLLAAARRHGLVGRAVDLRTSGDTAGPPDRVVGYGAFVFS